MVPASHLAVASIITLFVCRWLAADVLVPPWQGPDEPTHFALVQRLTRPDGSADSTIQEIERQVLQSMAQHDWWNYYQKAAPDPLPYAFSQVPEHLASGTLDQPAYYRLAASVLLLVPRADLEQQYVALRWLSGLLALLTLVCGWLGTRALFGELTAIGALAIAALHPQFLLSAVSVNPDVLINLCGAFIWWMVGYGRCAGGRRRIAGAVLMVGAAVVAALSKRNGIPLGIVALVSGGVSLGTSARRAVALAAGCGLTVVALVAGGVYISDATLEPARRLITFWGSILSSPRAVDWSFGRLGWFAAAALDTSWLSAGWMRFPAPDAWLWVARVLTVVGLAGVAGLWRTVPESRSALKVAVLFVVIHAGTLLAVALLAGAVPQGRYLFGALFPIAVLIWSGVLFFGGPAARPSVMIGIVGLVAILDMVGFFLVLIPAYVQQ